MLMYWLFLMLVFRGVDVDGDFLSQFSMVSSFFSILEVDPPLHTFLSISIVFSLRLNFFMGSFWTRGYFSGFFFLIFFFLAERGLYCGACTLVVVSGLAVPPPGIKLVSLALEGRFLTTGSPGKSPDFFGEQLPNCFPEKMCQFILHSVVYKDMLFP